MYQTIREREGETKSLQSNKTRDQLQKEEKKITETNRVNTAHGKTAHALIYIYIYIYNYTNSHQFLYVKMSPA